VFDKSSLVSAIAGYPTYTTFFSTIEKLVIGGVPFEAAGERPTRREALAYYRRVAEAHGLSVRLFENVSGIERLADGTFLIKSESVAAATTTAAADAAHSRQGSVTAARAVVIATGYFSSPNMLGVPGESLPHVSHRFVEGHEAFQRDAFVLGGGNSAAECAMELARCGARVTLAHYEKGFISHVIKPWIMPEFEAQIAAGQITMAFESRVTAIDSEFVYLTSPAGASKVRAQHVYLMTGYTPRAGLLGALGVHFDPATGIPEHNPLTMETPTPGVYVAGVLTSGLKANGIFIENGRGHGELIAAALAQHR